jgi:hypothetical protein
MSQVLGAMGCWISPCYSPFSLGARFETYELFISLIFQFFSGHGEPRILNRRICGHACTLKLSGLNPSIWRENVRVKAIKQY